MDARTLTRRDFVQRATALAAIPALPGGLSAASAAAKAPAPRWPGYAHAVVVDFLASPGYFNYPADPPLDATMAHNAVESGITGVNLTVSAGDHEATVAKIARWEAEIERYPQALQRVRSLAQLQEAKRTGRLGIIYGFQDAVPIDGDLGRLGVFADLGVKVIQLTYNIRNLVGDGCLEPSNAGLSNYGHQMVERMNELGILVDLSHCGQSTTADGILASSRPVAISHTGCSAVAPHPRNKRDEELRMLAERGGVAGIYLMPFLFVYTSILNVGWNFDFITTVIASCFALVSWGGALTGYLLRRTTLIERGALFVSSLLLLHEGLITDIIGYVLLALVIVLQKLSPGKGRSVASGALNE